MVGAGRVSMIPENQAKAANEGGSGLQIVQHIATYFEEIRGMGSKRIILNATVAINVRHEIDA
jgi:hypothetical protein